VNNMNAIRIANLVGRGSRTTERVSRVYGLSGRQMFWAEKRAEPWVTVCYENYRRDSRIGLATRWARLGERKGVAKVIGMKKRIGFANPCGYSGASPHQL